MALALDSVVTWLVPSTKAHPQAPDGSLGHAASTTQTRGRASRAKASRAAQAAPALGSASPPHRRQVGADCSAPPTPRGSHRGPGGGRPSREEQASTPSASPPAAARSAPAERNRHATSERRPAPTGISGEVM